ncbi:PseG/SpsG family protein [Thermodesulfobacteriota bacterium]
MQASRELICRVDGGISLGIGHLQRSVVLNAELKSEFNVSYYIREDDTGYDYLENAGLKTFRIPAGRDEREEAEILLSGNSKISAPIVLLDILDTSKSYMAALKRYCSKIVTFENMGPGASMAELVINAIVEGPESKDFVLNGTRYLKGARHKVLSPDFNINYSTKKKDKNPRIIVTLGGGDLAGILPKVLRAIADTKKDINVTAIAGPAYQGFETLKRDVRGLSLKIDLRKEVSNMAKELSGVDIAITAGGGTLYEIAFMGVPGIVTCQCDHQQVNAAQFEKRGAVINLGDSLNVTSGMITEAVSRLLGDPEKRKEMSEKGMRLIDGEGRRRVSHAIKELGI